MSKGWIIGTEGFVKTLVSEQRALVGQGPRLAAELQQAREAIWRDELEALLRKVRKQEADLAVTGKSVDWKLAVASVLKERTTVTNRWLAVTLHMGNLHEVSRKISAWNRHPDPALRRKLQ